MAYGQGSNNNRGGYSNNASRQAAGGNKTAAQGEGNKPIFTTGLFAPKSGKKAIGTVFLKEAVTLPKGSSIILKEVTEEDVARLTAAAEKKGVELKAMPAFQLLVFPEDTSKK